MYVSAPADPFPPLDFELYSRASQDMILSVAEELRLADAAGADAAETARSGLVIGPCGIGKSLVMLGLAQYMEELTILHLPLLQLISQLGRRIRQEFRGKVFVISSQAGGYLDPKALAAEMLQCVSAGERFMVLATYKSSWVAKAAQDHLRGCGCELKFGLQLCDEAHNIRRGGYGGAALEVLAAFRVMFTATPTRALLDIVGGKVFYHMTWQEALAAKIIVPLELVPLCVKTALDGALREEADAPAFARTAFPDFIDRVTMLAQAIALLSVMEASAHHCFAFCATNVRVKGFAALLEHCATLLGLDILVLEMTGLDSDSDRDEKLRKFASAARGVLVNCYVCQEGIDLPICDSCFLADARSSWVALMQIAGRAMRPDPQRDKVKGLFIIALFLVCGELGDLSFSDWEELVMARASDLAVKAAAPAQPAPAGPQPAPAGAAGDPQQRDLRAFFGRAPQQQAQQPKAQGEAQRQRGGKRQRQKQQQQPEGEQPGAQPGEQPGAQPGGQPGGQPGQQSPPPKKKPPKRGPAEQLKHNTHAASIITALMGAETLVTYDKKSLAVGASFENFRVANIADASTGRGVAAEEFLQQLVARQVSLERSAQDKRFETMVREKFAGFLERPVRTPDPARSAEDSRAQTIGRWRRDFSQGVMPKRHADFLDGFGFTFDWRLDANEADWRATLAGLTETVKRRAGNLSPDEERDLGNLKNGVLDSARRALLEEFALVRDAASAAGSHRIAAFFPQRPQRIYDPQQHMQELAELNVEDLRELEQER